ncbi:hypothetical protein DPMN_014742 [Dreissena polymorpha]|uniref:Uncharacterized protein n=1 Tax=Dreissena polymorpha TaxID=45954 RepID=A0A9D4S5I4_DREPO|nr:hypothetical protein DPMN_014742 [Dreissena polymorpha]
MNVAITLQWKRSARGAYPRYMEHWAVCSSEHWAVCSSRNYGTPFSVRTWVIVIKPKFLWNGQPNLMNKSTAS